MLERRGARLGLGRLGALGVALLLAAAGCDESGGGKKTVQGTISPAPYTRTSTLTPGNVTTISSGAVNVTADVPQDALSMGIAVIGTDTAEKFIEHGGLFLNQGDNIKGPNGAVPYTFPMFDFNGDGDNDDPVAVALNNEAVALHFPNDGTNTSALEAGTYKFPVGAASGGSLTMDTLTPHVFYKRETATVPTLMLNVVVLEGASGGITSDATANSDAEILGALAVLQNVYGDNANVALNVNVTVDYVTNADLSNPLGTPGVVNSDSEQFALLQSYPTTPTHDAMNIFIINQLGYLPGGVIGLAAGIPGPFNRHGTATSGTLAEYQGDGTGTILGFTLAHEFGHFLGLFHTSQTDGSTVIGEDTIADTPLCTTQDVQQAGSIDNCPDRDNLMFPFVDDNTDPPVSVGQGNVIKYNPGITVP